jgi:D-serine deaminase-like pyridoxal phosphate-dependent protein
MTACTMAPSKKATSWLASRLGHGLPELPGATVKFSSDEHTTITPSRPVGDRAWLVPAHVDPTMAYQERVHVISGDAVVDTWPVDLRGW